MGYPLPMTEYPFGPVRAIENLLLTGQCANYPGVTMIFAHGGGAIPYLAARIAGMSSMPFLGSSGCRRLGQAVRALLFRYSVCYLNDPVGCTEGVCWRGENFDGHGL